MRSSDQNSKELGSVLGTVVVSIMGGVGYWAVGLPWWLGAAVAPVSSVGISIYKLKTRKPLRADPRRIAQLEYELGFTDKKPRSLPAPKYGMTTEQATRALCAFHKGPYKRPPDDLIKWREMGMERHRLHTELAAQRLKLEEIRRKVEDR